MALLIFYAFLFAVILPVAIYAPAMVRRVVEGIIWLYAALVGLEVISGIARGITDWASLGSFHRWTAHLLVVLCWTVVAASLAFLTTHLRRHLRASVIFCFLSFIALAFAILASFTGYLAPFKPGTLAETRVRFFWLHELVSPCALAAIAPFWVRAIRRFRNESPTLENSPDRPTDPPPSPSSDNPYAAPSED
jgi:hypothetical protein